MDEKMCMKTLDHLHDEEQHHGPLGGMAWDEVA